MFENKDYELLLGNSLDKLKELPDCSVQTCITSPPYYALRDYGTGHWEGGDPNCKHTHSAKQQTFHKDYIDTKEHREVFYKDVCPLCGAVRVDEQIGLEETPEQYIKRLVDVFHEVKRVLKDDGTLWVNIGDSYASNSHSNHNFDYADGRKANNSDIVTTNTIRGDIKQKDLIGIPWELAFALRADGWYLRQDIIWCISGGAYIYARTQKGVMPIMVRELARMDISKVELWNGENWVKINGFCESNYHEKKLEITLRSGERIGCTDGHKWVLMDGTEVLAKDLKVGDVLKSVTLPDCDEHTPGFLTDDALWLLGLYLAEGSHSDDTIQIALNSNEFGWYDKIKSTVEFYGGTTTYTINENTLNIRLYSKVFDSIISQYIGGRTAKDKHLNNICWRMPNSKLKCLLSGYFDGDGSYDGDRIRLGFTRNYYFERDLRVAASRLGATLTLNLSESSCNGNKFKSFRGEWRWNRSGYFNEKDRCEIVKIGKSRARHFYDISVDSNDHTYALASGVITHNCKPNPMPESVTDRCTKSHEYIFLLSKKPDYYFDSDAIKEDAVTHENRLPGITRNRVLEYNSKVNNNPEAYLLNDNKPHASDIKYVEMQNNGELQEYLSKRNKRDVWEVGVSSYKGAHFATYPEKLIEPCVLAGTKEGDVVLDVFNGSGTTGAVAMRHGRKYIGIDLNQDYLDITVDRFNTLEGISKVEDSEGNSVYYKQESLF